VNIQPRHRWALTIEAAIAIQQQLRSEVVTTDQLDSIQHIAGVDVGFEAGGTVTRAAVVVLSFPDLQLQEQTIARRPTEFPYVPGFLSFREAPAILDALEQIKITPNLILCDGHGIAHPRRFGIACHLGVLTNLPTVGVGKSILVGTHAELATDRGTWQLLHHKNEIIGAALRTRVGVKPVYISPGHRISVQTAIDYVLGCTTKYRLPEATRLADKLASHKESLSVGATSQLAIEPGKQLTFW